MGIKQAFRHGHGNRLSDRGMGTSFPTQTWRQDLRYKHGNMFSDTDMKTRFLMQSWNRLFVIDIKISFPHIHGNMLSNTDMETSFLTQYGNSDTNDKLNYVMIFAF